MIFLLTTLSRFCIMTFADSEKLSFPFIYFEAWLSLVERCVRDAEVVGSNPVAPTGLKWGFLKNRVFQKPPFV